ncbi:MAG: hypothetical protein ETSY2_15715 [Candidatus Entotheonella gemina]|uniref:Uncharacterized protein n=1 Tax=Candidatus Entotheonella gemina TaxID=1429439 RepID=W4MAK6_9BACT|nr:MAG: hypothetical protein ETSY2_15715 [Candidatus Entotheonella gemina]
MASILAIAWFPTLALICGLVFGVLTLSCACLMIIKEQRPSGISSLLAILGAFLLIVSIWQSRSGNISELQAKIADLEQTNRQLAKEREETSGKQLTQGTNLSDTDTQLQTSLTTLQKATTQLSSTQTELNQSLAKVKQQTDQQANQVQELSDQQQKVSVEIQDQLKSISDSHSTKIIEHQRLLNDVVTRVEKLQTDFTTISANHSEQLENLEKQRQALAKQLNSMAKQHQMALNALREDVEATSAQGKDLNFVKASTQRELSNLRREVSQLQENIQQLQGRRHRGQ